jgi:hypothetical protein
MVVSSLEDVHSFSEDLRDEKELVLNDLTRIKGDLNSVELLLQPFRTMDIEDLSRRLKFNIGGKSFEIKRYLSIRGLF